MTGLIITMLGVIGCILIAPFDKVSAGAMLLVGVGGIYIAWVELS